MQTVKLKLKQASVVLGANPKDLQNLVQFGVVKPKRRAGIFWFDTSALLTASVALHLKEAFGIKTELLSQYAAKASACMEKLLKTKPEFLVFMVSLQETPMELRFPFRKVAEEVQQRLEQIPLFADLPRGRKRRGWKREFLATVEEAARDLGGVSAEEILETVRTYRKEKKQRPEIQVVAQNETARALGCRRYFRPCGGHLRLQAWL